MSTTTEQFLKTVAPTVASALLGPIGGTVIGAIGSILGLSEPTKTSIADALTAGQLTPEQLGQIKQLELQLQAEEKERGFRYSELEFRDRDSARDMFGATRSLTPSILTYAITIGFFTILVTLMVNEGKPSEPLLVMLGSLGTAWTACISFWFGTTSGSQAKTEIIAKSDAVKD